MYENSFNSSIIDTSSFRAEDFALFMDCLENLGTKNTASAEKVKKTRKTRSRAHRTKDDDVAAALNKTTGCDLGGGGGGGGESGGKRWAPSYFSSCYNLNDASAHDPNALANITCSTINQTINDDIDASVVSEQFNLNEVFAYFNADFDKTRFEDSDSNDESSKVVDRESEKGIVTKMVPKEKPTRTARPKRTVTHEAKNKTMLAPILSSSESERETATFKRPNAPPLARKIIAAAQKPNAKLPTNNDVAGNRLNRTMNDAAHVKQTQRYSSASTLSLHGSDSDTVVKPNSVADDSTKSKYVAPNVQDKISFFNRTISESSASPVTPSASVSVSASAPSASEDEDYQFQRQKSKRKFQQKREFFEKIFRERFSASDNEPASNDRTPIAPKSHALTQNERIDKLEAVETYVQTKYLLERIQLLIKAISNMDEAQMEKMNLKKLKKFLLFIRDCSYNCQQVCFDISEKFLTDFEKNVMSAEELLFSALKAVHMQQKVYKRCSKTVDNFYVSQFTASEMCHFFPFDSIHLILPFQLN